MGRIKYLTEQIEARYNPEHDVPQGVQVSWADIKLLEITKILQARIVSLQSGDSENPRVASLEKQFEVARTQAGEIASILEAVLDNLPGGFTSEEVETARSYLDAEWHD
jgi:hypothetical protein